MPFRPGRKITKYADLKGILTQSGKTDPALYQTIQVLLERLDQNQDITNEKVGEGVAGLTSILKGLASKFATYHTKDDEVSILPNSVQLLAGTGIAFDDTIPNKRTITTTVGARHYDCPLSDGDPIAADLIFAGGECVIVQVPV